MATENICNDTSVSSSQQKVLKGIPTITMSTFSAPFKLFSALQSGFPLYYYIYYHEMSLAMTTNYIYCKIQWTLSYSLSRISLASVIQYFFILLLFLWLLLSTLCRLCSNYLFDFLEYKFHEDRACGR